jgi:hypothetical protein
VAIASALSAHGSQTGASERSMNRTRKASPEAEMRSEYDFSKGTRGKYSERYHQGVVAVMLEPDIARVFKTSEAVNEALRVLVNISKSHVPRKTNITARTSTAKSVRTRAS